MKLGIMVLIMVLAFACRWNNTYHAILYRLERLFPQYALGAPSGHSIEDALQQVKLEAWTEISSSATAKGYKNVLLKAKKETKYAPYPDMVNGRDPVDPGAPFFAWAVLGKFGVALPGAVFNEAASAKDGKTVRTTRLQLLLVNAWHGMAW